MSYPLSHMLADMVSIYHDLQVWQKALFWGVNVAIGASLGFAAVTGGNHLPPPYSPTAISTVTVCPSAWTHYGAYLAARDRYVVQGCPAVSVRLGACEDGPRYGEAQVRACTDIVVLPDGGIGCPEGYWDTVSLLDDGAYALVYIAGEAPSGVEAHTLGHLLGLGHTTAATSVMAAEPGTDWDRVVCGGGL